MTPKGAHLANPNVNVANSFEKKLLGAKSGLRFPKPIGLPPSSMKNYHLSSSSSLPKPHGHTSSTRKEPVDYLPLIKPEDSAGSVERLGAKVVSSPYFSRESHYVTKSSGTDKTPSNSELDTLLANRIAKSGVSDKSSSSPVKKGGVGDARAAIRIPSVSSSGSSSCVQYSPAEDCAADQDADLVVLSDPSPASSKFNDTSLGLESENTVFFNSSGGNARSESEETFSSNTCSTDAERYLPAHDAAVAPTSVESERTNTGPTSKSGQTFPRDVAVPTLSREDFYISTPSRGDVASALLPSTKRRKKSSGDEVMGAFCVASSFSS